jgi:CRISPR-associated endonuclease Csy4
MDIRILADPEIPPPHLMSALFEKLHRQLVRIKAGDIGVSFPQVDAAKPHLGRVLRLHGTDATLAQLEDGAWLEGMRDHVHSGTIEPVPLEVEYRQVRRVQSKSSAERLRRRQMKRHNWTKEEAETRIPNSVERTLSLPYLTIGSGSTRQRFNLFIEHRVAQNSSAGRFNSYGLSDTATVPWF